jgi:hypothetical protein
VIIIFIVISTIQNLVLYETVTCLLTHQRPSKNLQQREPLSAKRPFVKSSTWQPHHWINQTETCTFPYTFIARLRDTNTEHNLYTVLRARWSGVRVSARVGNSSLHHRVQTGSGAHPASYSMGNRALFLWVKRPEREADHSPPSSAEVNNAWSYTSTPQYASVAWCSVTDKAQCSGVWALYSTVAPIEDVEFTDEETHQMHCGWECYFTLRSLSDLLHEVCLFVESDDSSWIGQ